MLPGILPGMDPAASLAPLQQTDPATVWAGVSALAAVITSLVAVFTLGHIRKDSRDATRPMVVAELRDVPLATATMALVVRNVGRSVARNVTITFDPPLPQPEDLHGGLVHHVNRRYADPIPTLTPGTRFENIWRFRGDADRGQEVPADRVVATAVYEDTRGRSYEDRYVLATDLYEWGTLTEPGGTDDKALQKREVKAVEAVARALDR